MYYVRFFIVVFFLCIVALSCERETDVYTSNDAYQYRYFPLSIGKVLEYQLDSVFFTVDSSGVRSLDSVSALIREEVIDTFRLGNDLSYVIIRSQLMPNGSWIPVGTMQAGQTEKFAWRTENQFRLLKMTYPMTSRSAWDGLIFINPDVEIEVRSNRIQPFSNWEFEVDSINKARTVGAFTFDSTLVITEADDVNAIERRFSRVVYALGIGAVSVERLILDSQYCNQNPAPTDCNTLPWEQKAERGFIVRQVITKY
jgi:hypothetical protein